MLENNHIEGAPTAWPIIKCLELPSAPAALGWLKEPGKGAGLGTLRDQMAKRPGGGDGRLRSSVKMQRKQQSVTGLREAGQEGGAASERLEPIMAARAMAAVGRKHAPSASTRSRARPPGPVTGAAAAAARPPTPPHGL